MKRWLVWNHTWTEKLIWTGTDEDATKWRRANLIVEEIV